MADPLSILSVAASITQFRDLGYRLIKGVKEIHDSAQGALEEVAELKLVAEDIKNLNQDFTSNLSSSRPLSKDDIAIRALAGKCNALADELLRELRPLTLPPRHISSDAAKRSRIHSPFTGMEGYSQDTRATEYSRNSTPRESCPGHTERSTLEYKAHLRQPSA